MQEADCRKAGPLAGTAGAISAAEVVAWTPSAVSLAWAWRFGGLRMALDEEAQLVDAGILLPC